MQVTSLLTNNPEPITKTPKFYIKAPSINWRHLIACWFCRLARCWNATEPGAYILMAVAGVLGVMFTVFPYMEQNHGGTFFGGVMHCVWTALWLTAVFEAIMYGIWEIVQGFKWIGKWAECTKREIAYEKEQKAREQRTR